MSEMNPSDNAQDTLATPPAPPATPAVPAPPVAPPTPVAQTPAPVAQTPAPVAQTPAPAPQDPQPAQFAAPVVHSMAVPPQQPAMTAIVAGSYGAQGMPYAGVPGQVTPPLQAPSATKLFFSRLFDMSFGSYSASSLVKITYILSLIAIWGTWLFSLIFGTYSASALDEYSSYFGGSGGNAVSTFFTILIGGGVLACLSTLFTRLSLEFFVAVANNAEDTRRLRELKEKEEEDK